MKRKIKLWMLRQEWLWKRYYNSYTNFWTYEHVWFKDVIVFPTYNDEGKAGAINKRLKYEK